MAKGWKFKKSDCEKKLCKNGKRLLLLWQTWENGELNSIFLYSLLPHSHLLSSSIFYSKGVEKKKPDYVVMLL